MKSNPYDTLIDLIGEIEQWGQLTRIPTSIITKKVNLLPEK